MILAASQVQPLACTAEWLEGAQSNGSEDDDSSPEDGFSPPEPSSSAGAPRNTLWEFSVASAQTGAGAGPTVRCAALTATGRLCLAHASISVPAAVATPAAAAAAGDGKACSSGSAASDGDSDGGGSGSRGLENSRRVDISPRGIDIDPLGRDSAGGGIPSEGSVGSGVGGPGGGCEGLDVAVDGAVKSWGRGLVTGGLGWSDVASVRVYYCAGGLRRGEGVRAAVESVLDQSPVGGPSVVYVPVAAVGWNEKVDCLVHMELFALRFV